MYLKIKPQALKIMILLATFVHFVSANVTAATDVNAGKQKSTTCAACHGEQGISTNDAWPNLAGQKASYIEAQLKAFRSGERKNEIMNGIARMYSDREVEDLAAFYAQLKGTP